MENKDFISPVFSKCILRSTGEEVEIIDSSIEERGARSEKDWVSYIDSNNVEYIKEHLNIQFDFKPAVTDTWSKIFDYTSKSSIPTTRNYRIFDTAKAFVIEFHCDTEEAIRKATEFVDAVGIETE